MRIIRDYRCSSCGATKEAFTDSRIALEEDDHLHVVEPGSGACGYWLAELSPTATTFKFADKSARKSARG